MELIIELLKNNITAFLSAATLLIGLINIRVSYRNQTKALFINTVTAQRIQYIGKIRELLAEFCAGFRTYHLSVDPKMAPELAKRSDILRYNIRLLLNDNDDFDRQVFLAMDRVISQTQTVNGEELETAINMLVSLGQNLLKFEWESIKREVKKGRLLTHTEKNELRQRYLATACPPCQRAAPPSWV